MIRYTLRHNINACKVLFTINKKEGTDDGKYKDTCDEFANHVSQSLRRSDIITRTRFNQYFLFLADIREEFINKVVDNIIETWYQQSGRDVIINYETEFIRNDGGVISGLENKHVVVVDDDETNLIVATKVLSDAGIRVTSMNPGIQVLLTNP